MTLATLALLAGGLTLFAVVLAARWLDSLSWRGSNDQNLWMTSVRWVEGRTFPRMI
jgi:hypothetical protein